MTPRTTPTSTPSRSGSRSVPSRSRRAVAAVVLGASSTLAVGCSAADVQAFFGSVGITISSSTAERIATLLTKIEIEKREREKHTPCPSPTTTAAPTTAAPTTTVVISPTVRSLSNSNRHGGCERHR